MVIGRLLKYKKFFILFMVLTLIFSSCAQATYYFPEGFGNLLDEIKKQTEYFYKGEIYSTVPTSLEINVYIKQDIPHEKIEKIKELVISYVRGEQFRNFAEGTNLYYDDRFLIIFSIETFSKTFSYQCYKKTMYEEWIDRNGK